MNHIYRELIEDSPMAYVHIKIKKNNNNKYIGLEIKDFNKAYKRFFGNYDENLINEYILNSMKKLDRLECIEIFRKASENKKYTKLIYVEKIDTHFNMEIFSIENDEFCIRFTKISNQCVKLSSVLKNSPYLTWIKDRNGVYIYVNDKFLEFFDKTYDEVIGKTDYAIMAKDFAKDIIDQDNYVMKNNKMNTYEDIHILNENKLGYLQSTKWPLSEDDNNIILGTIGIAIENN